MTDKPVDDEATIMLTIGQLKHIIQTTVNNTARMVKEDVDMDKIKQTAINALEAGLVAHKKMH